MSQEFVLGLAKQSLTMILMLAGPVLIVSLVVGVFISIIQATTQVQEPTLSFIPKIIAVFAVMLLLGSWMLNTLLMFTQELFNKMGTVLR
ncbi:MAG: flagellar biosynthesis protein FliQ [Bacillota bacterium]|jgi:flagellar biosynthetic protein FliQ